MVGAKKKGTKPLPLDPKESRKRKRERLAIVLLSILFVALSIFEFKLTRVSTTLPLVNSIFFFGLLNINIIILVAVTWLIARNMGKLFLERRSKVLGARLKTKLVFAFCAFSITPTVVLFIISALYINSSFDKWFSIRVQNTLEGSIEITKTFYKNAERTATHFAQHLATQLGSKLSSQTQPSAPPWLQAKLEEQRQLMALNAVEFYSDPFEERTISRETPEGTSDTQGDLPRLYPRLSLDLLDRSFSGNVFSVVQHVGTGDLLRTVVPVYAQPQRAKSKPMGVLAVSTYIPVSLVNKVDEISSVFGDYRSTNPLQYPIKTAYFVILLMITLVIIFVAIWLGLYLARELTVPVERLVRGARQVGSGDLDVHVESTGRDELGVLVDSFNMMTLHLKENRQKLTQASSALENRTMELEAVLANVGTGVVVIDHQGKVSTFNRAAAQLLAVEPSTVLGKNYRDVFKGEAKPISELIDRAVSEGDAEDEGPKVGQFNYRVNDTLKSLAGIVTALRENDVHEGVVIVIDDMTHLVKAQREVAWREVARRIAHEIKNPLTPIKLSAQRLQRQLGGRSGREGALLKECTSTIVKHTDELKEMVNEFSSFARFPEISPSVNQVNEAIEELVQLFSQAHPQIIFKASLEKRLKPFEFDRDQIKRVIMNLFDNAVSVLRNHPRPTIEITTHYNDQLQMAVILVEDNGKGMSEAVKARVFEPYFSTKKEGTGLGLAIAKRIINDHDGFIRVQSKIGAGTQFWIELPTSARKTSPKNKISPRASQSFEI